MVAVRNSSIELTGKEFDLLLFLASNKGRVFTKTDLYAGMGVMNTLFDDSNIMSFISKLRKKINRIPSALFYIQTVRGRGVSF